MRKLIYFFPLLLITLSATAQKKAVLKPDTIIKEVSVYSKMQADSLQQVYFEILKSTNEQLNNYWTPVNWFLGAAGLAVALLAIVATIVFFLQSSDFKRQKDKLFDEFRQKTDDFVEKSNSLLSNIEQQLADIVNEAKPEADRLRKEGKESEAQVLEDIIDKVDAAQMNISSKQKLRKIRIDQLFRTVKMECSGCGHEFSFMVPHSKKGGSVVCPQCKHITHYNE